jgi:hypothetical protein
MKAKEFIPASKPRNFVVKNQKTAGAGAHKDKKKAEKQGDVKHKNKMYDEGVAEGDTLDTGPDGRLTARGEEQMRQYRQQKREQERQQIIAKHTKTVKGDTYGVAPSRMSQSRNEVDWKAANKELRKKGLDEQGVSEGSDNLSIGQQMARDGITYSPDKEGELIKIMGEYMEKAGMSPKAIRYYLSYDEDFVSDQLEYLPRKGVSEGFFGIDDSIKGKIQNIVSKLSDVPGMWDHRAQTFTDRGMDKLKTVLKNNPKYIKYAVNLTADDYDESIEMERVRDPEDWDEGNTEPPNNFAVYINGKKWKVFQGRGIHADDFREKQHYQQLKDWARKKSTDTGKKWEVYITGESPTV